MRLVACSLILYPEDGPRRARLVIRRLPDLARSPGELPGESGRAKPSSLQKVQKSASGEGRGPKKYWKTQHICNMDLKNRAHSHVLAPDTKSTAPKHGSVGIFQKLGARGGKFPATSTIFRSKKGTFCNLNRYKQCTILRLSRLCRFGPINRRKWKRAGTYVSRA